MDEAFVLTDLFPILALALASVLTLRCLFHLPFYASTLRDTASRLNSLDAAEITLDFSSILQYSSTPTATTPHLPHTITVLQRFIGFHNTGLAVWGDSVSLSCYILRPQLLLAKENVTWVSNHLRQMLTKEVLHNSGHLRQMLSKEVLHKVVAMMPQLDNKAWVEVGCGVGVLSLALSKFGKGAQKFVATDGDAQTCTLASENVTKNNCEDRIKVVKCEWGNEKDHDRVGRHAYDVVVGSDLTYWPAPMDQLMVTVLDLVKPDGTVIFAHKDRQHSKSNDLKFFKDMNETFLEHACAFVMDQTSPGKTGGDVTEEPGMWIHVYRGLKKK